MKKHDKMKLEIESKSINEGFARAAVAAFAARLDPSLDELGDIKTAVSEAVTNCTVHAYPDAIGNVQITCRVFEDYIEIKVRDYGRGIADIARAREPMYTTGGSDRSRHGLYRNGELMDELRVRSREGVGTTVTMVKRIRPRK